MSEQQIRDKTNELVNDVINLIAGDADFRDALKADPVAAMDGAGFSSRIDGLVDEVEADSEVAGFGAFAPTIGGLSAIDLKNTTIVASGCNTPGCGPTPGCASGFNPYLGRDWRYGG